MGVVRNITNNDLYVYLGNDTYQNLRTKVSGNVPPETAQKIFKINLEATHFYYELPGFKELIHKLNLKIDKQ